MTRWFFSYLYVGAINRPAQFDARRDVYYQTDPGNYSTEAECIAAATAYRMRTGNADIQIHKRGKGGRSATYKLGT